MFLSSNVHHVAVKDVCYWRQNFWDVEVIVEQFKPFNFKYIMVDFEKGLHKGLKKAYRGAYAAANSQTLT